MAQDSGILIVDDQEDFAKGLARLVGAELDGVPCRTAFSGAQALEYLERHPVSVLVSDLRMPGLSGLELMERALALVPNLSVILLTAHGSIETAVAALKQGAYDFLTKPIDQESLIRVVRKALERSRLIDENRRLRELMGGRHEGVAMIGDSLTMRRLRETIAAVAGADYTVLIRGESGTGKELAARSVHAHSDRADKPFVAVNCSAIPAELLESELFGHVKGAFTGADRDRKGLFQSANGGTLLLDEIGDISPDMQTKLLRVLQEREVRAVGSSASDPVDVRILATTNADLEGKIQDGSFREDLFYRLNVLELRLPPLRDHKDDVPMLAEYFLRQTCQEMNGGGKDGREEEAHSLTPEVVSHLVSRPWPGNIRELQNFMRKLAVFCRTGAIDMSLVRFVEGQMESNGAGYGEDGVPSYREAKQRVVDEFSRAYVVELLTRTGGNVSEAARVGGLERVSLQKILKRLDIDPASFRNGA